MNVRLVQPGRWLKGWPMLFTPGFLAILCTCFMLILSVNAKGSEYEEVPVTMNLQGYGRQEMNGLMADDRLYLAVTEVFDFLKIRNTLAADGSSVSGFFLREENRYEISCSKRMISLGKEQFALNPEDLFNTGGSIYLRSEMYGKIFKLECKFDFRNLFVNLTTPLELPVLKQQYMVKMRNAIGLAGKDVLPDTVLKPVLSAFHLGAADYSITNIRQPTGGSNSQMSLRIGTALGAGEANFLLNYNTGLKFDLKDQVYQWRYVNNEMKAVRQVMIGKIAPLAISPLYTPLTGFHFTNASTKARESFGSYTLRDHTEPGWTVELYVNETLIGYTQADASGFYSFDIPLIYGNTRIKLKFFGQFGEERTSEREMSIPYQFLPKKEMEYNVSGGIRNDRSHDLFSRADIRYGVNKFLTLAGGAEYLSSLSRSGITPFINAHLRLSTALFVSGDYIYGVAGKAMASYKTSSDILFEANYTKYTPGQRTINTMINEERKLLVSKPLRTGSFSFNSTFTVQQFIYSGSTQTRTGLLFSGAVGKMGASISSHLSQSSHGYRSFNTRAGISTHLGWGVLLQPELQYSHTTNKINEVKLELGKRFFSRMQVNLSYENNLQYNNPSVALSVQTDLRFARVSAHVRRVGNTTTFSQSTSGSFLFNGLNGMRLNNQSNAGKSRLVISPYLDINGNNRRDRNEPKIEGLDIKASIGRVQKDMADTTITISELEPFASCLLELNLGNVDDISWELKKTRYEVITEPNKLKVISVPVSVGGEVTGTIKATTDLENGGRITVQIYKDGKILCGTALVDRDGSFSLRGLAPGAYTARVDPVQLTNLKAQVWPARIDFNLKAGMEGDIADKVDFTISTDAGPRNAQMSFHY